VVVLARAIVGVVDGCIDRVVFVIEEVLVVQYLVSTGGHTGLDSHR
jgi:hypothetical protein